MLSLDVDVDSVGNVYRRTTALAIGALCSTERRQAIREEKETSDEEDNDTDDDSDEATTPFG